MRLRFPKVKVKQKLNLGGYLMSSDMNLKQVVVESVADYFRVHIVMECAVSSDTSVHEPERIIGIDIGGECIAAITNNTGLPPILVSGGKLREMNRNVLSAVADAKSVLRQGLDLKVRVIRIHIPP